MIKEKPPAKPVVKPKEPTFWELEAEARAEPVDLGGETDIVGAFVTREFESAFRALATHYGEKRAREFATFLGRKLTTEHNNDFKSRMLRDTRRASGLNTDEFIRKHLMPADADTMEPDDYDRIFKAHQQRMNRAENNPALDDIKVLPHPSGDLVVLHLPKPGKGRPRKNAT
jgi:hypothetical protein